MKLGIFSLSFHFLAKHYPGEKKVIENNFINTLLSDQGLTLYMSAYLFCLWLKLLLFPPMSQIAFMLNPKE